MPTPSRPFRTAAAAAVGLALLLAGCSSAPSPAPSSGPTTAGSAVAGFDDADVTFAQLMIPHHQQAVQLSDVILAKTGVDPEVRTLATRIKAAQAPEIATMSRWLTAWGKTPGAMAMDPGADGMMSDADLRTLQADGGAAGQRLYLTGMMRHHRGAVAMARTEITAGTDPDAVALAKSIVATQSTEIRTMQKILARL